MANRLSYEEVSQEIARHSGGRLLSADRLRDIVVEKARQISLAQVQQAQQVLSSAQTMPEVAAEVDLYEPAGAEVLILWDGIQVKRQKAQRSPLETEPLVRPQAQTETKRVNTDVMMLQQQNQDFRYLLEGLAQDNQASLSLPHLSQAALSAEYGQPPQPLPLIAISDGARHIRLLFEQIFAQPITLILDWYHLQKKCQQLLSMIAGNKSEKETHLQAILTLLWHGHTQQALTYLQTQVSIRNPLKFEELVTYLTKHAAEIIDYDRRQQAGKTIGSGRMEKGVDLIIAHRQKHKGMSWSDLGSRQNGRT